jgi:hypothetical protein
MSDTTEKELARVQRELNLLKRKHGMALLTLAWYAGCTQENRAKQTLKAMENLK